MESIGVPVICGCVLMVSKEDLDHLSEDKKGAYLQSKLVEHVIRQHRKKDVPLTPQDIAKLESVFTPKK